MAQSGRSGAVTIATNMAGRGTDIILGGNPEFMARLKLREMLMPRVVSQIEGENVLAQGSTTKVLRSHAPPLHPGTTQTACVGSGRVGDEVARSHLGSAFTRAARSVACVCRQRTPRLLSCPARWCC